MEFAVKNFTRIHFTLARDDLFVWVAEKSSVKIEKLEDLQNGDAFCLILHRMFPGCLNLNQVKISPKTDYEREKNFRLLQNAFTKLNIKQDVRILEVTKHLVRIWDFAVWFYHFYAANLEVPRLSPPSQNLVQVQSINIKDENGNLVQRKRKLTEEEGTPEADIELSPMSKRCKELAHRLTMKRKFPRMDESLLPKPILRYAWPF